MLLDVTDCRESRERRETDTSSLDNDSVDVGSTTKTLENVCCHSDVRRPSELLGVSQRASHDTSVTRGGALRPPTLSYDDSPAYVVEIVHI